jgi:transcriptional regulator
MLLYALSKYGSASIGTLPTSHTAMSDGKSRDLFPGALEMMVLRLLKQEPMHGYALVQRIHQVSRNLLQVEEGSLYPALQRLLKDDLVQAEWGTSSTNRRVRIYRLTRAGSRHLTNEVSRFDRMLQGINLVLTLELGET